MLIENIDHTKNHIDRILFDIVTLTGTEEEITFLSLAERSLLLKLENVIELATKWMNQEVGWSKLNNILLISGATV